MCAGAAATAGRHTAPRPAQCGISARTGHSPPCAPSPRRTCPHRLGDEVGDGGRDERIPAQRIGLPPLQAQAGHGLLDTGGVAEVQEAVVVQQCGSGVQGGRRGGLCFLQDQARQDGAGGQDGQRGGREARRPRLYVRGGEVGCLDLQDGGAGGLRLREERGCWGES